MHWYLVHTKPRQERRALENLERQGCRCYLPVLIAEKLRQGKISSSKEPLFPRYLFIELGGGKSDPSWAPIRSTLGVSRLVSFGIEPAKVNPELIARIREQEEKAQAQPEPLFTVGQSLVITEGPFAGVEGIFKMKDGDARVVVLIEMLSQPVEALLGCNVVDE